MKSVKGICPEIKVKSREELKSKKTIENKLEKIQELYGLLEKQVGSKTMPLIYELIELETELELESNQ